MAKKRREVVRKKVKFFSVDNVYVLIALILFNLLFVLHLIIGVAGTILGFIAGSIGMMIAGIIGFLVSLIYPLVSGAWVAEYISFGGLHPFAAVLLSITIFCVGALWMILNFFIGKYFIKFLIWYWKLNVRCFRRYEP
jgi:uncharacterized membrane protein